MKNKISGFKRDVIFNLVKNNQKKNFIGYVYSGISIINKKINTSIPSDHPITLKLVRK